MNKKNIVIILLVIVITIAIVTLYGTFASSNTVNNSDDTSYNITITGSTEDIVVPANSSKTVIYQITNTNKGKVQYGIAYSGTNITVRIYNDSEDQEAGLIDYGENKFVKLYISNNGTTESTATIKTILGYENGGDLIIPSGYTLATEKYPTIAQYITSLYTESPKTTVTNNSITYNYAASVSLMNDRLGGTTEGLDAGNVRYYGANPNNYIYFNCSDYTNQSADTCELWRIIGVFDGKVKIVRNDSIGNFSWDNKDTSTGAGSNLGKNDWTTARLMKLLNPNDYYKVDANDNGLGQSLYYTAQSGTCYRGENNATESCDFTSAGLKNDTTRNMIEEVLWNLGGLNTSSVYSDQIYGYERGTTVYSGRPTSWTGKVALAYPSDYGYAADFNSCTQTLDGYDASTCINVNWMKMMFGSNYMWFLTPGSSGAHFAWYVESSGYLSSYGGAGYVSGVRPALYLNSVVGIVSGNGTEAKPYLVR